MTAALEQYLLIAGVLLVGVAAVYEWRKQPASGNSRSTGLAAPLLSNSVLMFAAAVTVRWVREQQGPFLTLYDVILSNLATLSTIFLVVYLVAPALRITSLAMLPMLVILGAWSLVVPAEAVPLPPTFDNGWLWLHVGTGKVFLGLCMIATAGSILLLAGSRLPAGLQGRLQPLEAAVWPVFALAFLAHSFMLIAGAVWAHSAWGRYWAWDPLETWSLITWLAMALLLHLRVTYRRMPEFASWLGVISIYALAFLTFFGVPFVSEAPHKGVM